MSGIYGLYNRAGRVVDPRELEPMQKLFAQWFNDDSGTWCGASTALGHTMLWNTPESKLEKLPAIDGTAENRLAITADVRLDNRAELAKKLGIDAPLITVTDSQLLMAAYRKWGQQSPQHLLGDFVYVIWDEQCQQLFCVRDHVGVKSLYYTVVNNFFIFSNHVNGVSCHEAVPKELNAGAAAQFFMQGGLTDSRLTFFKHISALPPASHLTISTSGSELTRYWHIEDSPRIKMASAKDYQYRLRSLLETSVKDRLRSDYPIATHISGGLDSSGIAALAMHLLAGSGHKLLAYNWLHQPSPATAADDEDWLLAREVSDHLGLKTEFSRLNADHILNFLQTQDISSNDYSPFWYEPLVRRSAARAGARVILSGSGGDELITNFGSHAHRLRSVRAWLKAQFSNKKSKPVALPGYLNNEFSVLCKDQYKDYSPTPALSVRANQVSRFNEGDIQARIAAWNAAAQTHALEYRYPLLDKRIIEFAVGIPGQLFRKGNTGRYLYRLALNDLLPKSICWGNKGNETQRVQKLIALEHSALTKYVNNANTTIFNAPQAGNIADWNGLREALEQITAKSMDSNSDRLDEMDQLIRAVMLLTSTSFIKQ